MFKEFSQYPLTLKPKISVSEVKKLDRCISTLHKYLSWIKKWTHVGSQVLCLINHLFIHHSIYFEKFGFCIKLLYIFFPNFAQVESKGKISAAFSGYQMLLQVLGRRAQTENRSDKCTYLQLLGELYETSIALCNVRNLSSLLRYSEAQRRLTQAFTVIKSWRKKVQVEERTCAVLKLKYYRLWFDCITLLITI